jgi:hypothetical protein
LLKNIVSIEEYQKARKLPTGWVSFTAEYKESHDSTEIIPKTKNYWGIVPEYTYARCPFCNTPVLSKIDTYSLYRFAEGKLLNALTTLTVFGATSKFPYNPS